MHTSNLRPTAPRDFEFVTSSSVNLGRSYNWGRSLSRH